MPTVESRDPDVEHDLSLMPTLRAIQAGASPMPEASIAELTEQATAQ